MSLLNKHLGVTPVRAFADNYIWLIESPVDAGQVVAIDPGEAEPVLAALKASGKKLAAILLTHHHPDHIGGVAELLAQHPIPVIGPKDVRILQITRAVADGERLELSNLGLNFEILHLPGHTLSHVAFLGHGALFCGDTLFSAGCGRMFEGTPTQMHTSLDRLSLLPPDTRIYCGHEYTAANLKFALTVEPSNSAARDYSAKVNQLRTQALPTLPSSVALETSINPFLRCHEPAVRSAAEARAGRPLREPADVFAVLRAWKDTFQS